MKYWYQRSSKLNPQRRCRQASQVTTKSFTSSNCIASHISPKIAFGFPYLPKAHGCRAFSSPICRSITHKIVELINTYLDAVNRSLFRAHFGNISIMVRLTRRDTHKSRREKRGKKKKRGGEEKKREWKLKKFYLANNSHRKFLRDHNEIGWWWAHPSRFDYIMSTDKICKAIFASTFHFY